MSSSKMGLQEVGLSPSPSTRSDYTPEVGQVGWRAKSEAETVNVRDTNCLVAD